MPIDLANQTGLIPQFFYSVDDTGNKTVEINSNGALFTNSTTARSLGLGAGGFLINGTTIVDAHNFTAVAPNPQSTEFVINNNIIVQDVDSLPANVISIKAGINGNVGSFFGLDYQSTSNQDFTIQSSTSGSIKYIQTGVGATTKEMVLNPTEILLQDTASAESLMLTNSALTYVSVGSTTYTRPLTEIVNDMPTYILNANSNNTVSLPTYTSNNHQIILQSAPIPVIDMLVPTGYTLTGEQINSSNYANGYLVLGCESGNVYSFFSGTWNLIATFNGSVRCVYWSNPQAKLYIGGKFDTITYPFNQGGLNYVCWVNSSTSVSAVGTDVWSNYGTNGFNDAVNTIISDNQFMYFGGEFEMINGGGLSCPFIACYDWNGTQYIYDLGGGGGGGFNGNVYSMTKLNDNLIVVGNFTSVNSNIGSQSVNYCINLLMFNGSNSYLVNSYDYFAGNPFALSSPITQYNALMNDGNLYVYISTNESVSGVNYLFQAPYYTLSAIGAIGGNAYNTAQTSFNLQGGVQSVGGDSIYLLNGTSVLTFPYGVYIYYNYSFNRQEFLDTGTGIIYFFGGSTLNKFSFQGGRIMTSQGTNYTSGWSITPAGNGYGSNATLLWNGSYYIPLSINGINAPYS